MVFFIVSQPARSKNMLIIGILSAFFFCISDSFEMTIKTFYLTLLKM